MGHWGRVLRAGTVALGICSAGTAAADTLGGEGPITAIALNAPGTPGYHEVVGRLVLREQDHTLREYNWGGGRCPRVAVDEPALERLRATLGVADLLVAPRYREGGGGARCLVAFDVVRTPLDAVLTKR